MARLQGPLRGEETAREQYATVKEALQIAGEVNGWMVRQTNFKWEQDRLKSAAETRLKRHGCWSKCKAKGARMR